MASLPAHDSFEGIRASPVEDATSPHPSLRANNFRAERMNLASSAYLECLTKLTAEAQRGEERKTLRLLVASSASLRF